MVRADLFVSILSPLLFMLFIEVPYQLPNIIISFKSLFNLFDVLSALGWRFYIFWSAIASFSFPLSPIISAMAPSKRGWGTTEHTEIELNLEDLTTLIPHDCFLVERSGQKQGW